jgi:hypothetical protein
MRLKLHMTVYRAVVVAVVAALSIAASFAVSATATSSRSEPVARSACRHIGFLSSSPCIVGNVFVECGLRFGACEYQKYLRCKMSAEQGKVVTIKQSEGIEETKLANPYRIVTCKGSATILKVYITKGEHEPYVEQLVRVHGAHSLTITLHWRRHSLSDSGLTVMAQH